MYDIDMTKVRPGQAKPGQARPGQARAKSTCQGRAERPDQTRPGQTRLRHIDTTESRPVAGPGAHLCGVHFGVRVLRHLRGEVVQ